MQGLREERDSDRISGWRSVSEHKTDETPFELSCQTCNRPLFVDQDTLDQVNDSVAKGLENPLVCDGCRQAYEERAHAAG